MPENDSFDRSSPFLRQDALRAGLARAEIDGPGYHRLFGSVRVSVRTPVDLQVTAQAATLVVPRGVVSHHTAAAFYRAAVPESSCLHLTVPAAKDRRRRTGIQCHVGKVSAPRRSGRLLLTTPEGTFVDLVPSLDLVDLVVLGDSLVHLRHTTPERLVDAAESLTGRHRSSAMAAAELVRAGAESPMETRLRLLLVLAGFPEPRLQLSLLDGTGAPRYRLDLCYPELRVAIEYDGRHHAEDERQWVYDLARREWLDGQRWRLVVVRSADIFGDPWATVRRIAGVLADQGYERPLPPTPPAAFSAHFPAQPWRTGRL